MSNDNNKVVSQKVDKAEVHHTKIETRIDFESKQFVEILYNYSDDKKHKSNGVLASFNLKELENRLNSFKSKNGLKKKDNPAILKGIYTKGTKGKYCERSSPFIFFDIDVKDNIKKRENVILFDQIQNIKVFNRLKEIALLVWRSSSKNGMAGILYVPQIVEFNNDTRRKHKIVAEAVYTYLSKLLCDELEIALQFDNAQGAFRQIRFLADQQGQYASLNKSPYEFRYSIDEIELKSKNGINKYYLTNQYHPKGSIEEQFNQNTLLLDLLPKFNYKILENNRVKSPETSATSSGELKNNILINYSSSSGSRDIYTPFTFVLEHQYQNDYISFLIDLRNQGYENKKLDQASIKSTICSLKKDIANEKDKNKIEQIIFKYCFDLRTLNQKGKIEFISKVNPNKAYQKHFYEYLQIGYNNEIVFDEYEEINQFASEKFVKILDLVDNKEKILVHAETGTGKTTAIFKEFKKFRPESRCLVLAPLTIIVNQLQKDHHDKAVFLTGESHCIEHNEAISSQIVVATYEQGIKHLKEYVFDYVFVDEAHQLITANAYKDDIISELTQNLNSSRIIGLTGTPQLIFKKLGFCLLSINKINQKKTDINLRYWNTQPYKIIINHLRNVKGKVLFKLDEKNTLEQIKNELIDNGNFKKNEILILYSDRKVKNSNDFRQLASERKFNNEIRIVLTTSLINEGLSIEQKEFTDIVYIENNFYPRPEPIKQFFARFRNSDFNRKNYLYLKHTIEPRSSSNFNMNLNFDTKEKLLLKDTEDLKYENIVSSYNDLTDPSRFFYTNGEINKFYLAYHVTECFFRSINEKQFKDFLEINYNLDLINDKEFNEDIFKGSDIDTSGHLDRKKAEMKKIGQILDENIFHVLDVVASNTLSKKIRESISIKNYEVEPKIFKFIVNHLKTFEYYVEMYLKFQHLGKNEINLTIKNKSFIMPKSKNQLNKELFNLKIEKLLKEPKNKTDVKNRNKLLSFALSLLNKRKFTFKEMMNELKKNRIFNFDSYTRKTCFLIFKHFNFKIKEDKNGLISIENLGGDI